MRPIESRGKRKDNGEWAYGWYAEVEGYYFIIDKNAILRYHDCPDGIHGIVEVLPETVGQSTGKKDKNGKKAYFGQRLKDEAGKEYEIVWIDLLAAFWVIQTEYPYEKYTAEVISKCEVIGDIHTTPLEDK